MAAPLLLAALLLGTASALEWHNLGVYEFAVLTEAMPFAKASEFCVTQLSAELASVHSLEELALVRRLATLSRDKQRDLRLHYLWLGARSDDAAKSFDWLDESAFDIVENHFPQEAPCLNSWNTTGCCTSTNCLFTSTSLARNMTQANRCLGIGSSLSLNYGYWHDLRCTRPSGFICKRFAPVSTTTTTTTTPTTTTTTIVTTAPWPTCEDAFLPMTSGVGFIFASQYEQTSLIGLNDSTCFCRCLNDPRCSAFSLVSDSICVLSGTLEIQVSELDTTFYNNFRKRWIAEPTTVPAATTAPFTTPDLDALFQLQISADAVTVSFVAQVLPPSVDCRLRCFLSSTCQAYTITEAFCALSARKAYAHDSRYIGIVASTYFRVEGPSLTTVAPTTVPPVTSAPSQVCSPRFAATTLVGQRTQTQIIRTIIFSDGSAAEIESCLCQCEQDANCQSVAIAESAFCQLAGVYNPTSDSYYAGVPIVNYALLAAITTTAPPTTSEATTPEACDPAALRAANYSSGTSGDGLNLPDIYDVVEFDGSTTIDSCFCRCVDNSDCAGFVALPDYGCFLASGSSPFADADLSGLTTEVFLRL